MILAIRTDSPVTHLALLDGNKVINESTWESGRELAKSLLRKITELCSDTKISLADIEGIICYKGPGSFTGLRIGITVANTLAYANDIPIVGANRDDWLEVAIKKLQAGVNESLVIPEYGAEAHITL